MRPVTRTIGVGAASLALFLMVAAFVTTTGPAQATVPAAPEVQEAQAPRAPSDVTQLLLPLSTAAYNGLNAPATKVYAPWLLAGTSVLRLLNTNQTAAATVRATFTYTTGVKHVETVLAPGAVGEIATTGFLTRAQLSAIVTATQPIVAVVNDFGPAGAQASSYAAVPAALGQRFVALPDILSESGGGWDSQVVVQNVGSVAADVTIVYTQTFPLALNNWPDKVSGLEPGKTYLFRPRNAGVTPDSLSIATLRSGQPMIAIVRNAATEVNEIYPRLVYIYRSPLPGAGGGGSHPLLFPLLINGYTANGFKSWQFSEIQLMNAGPNGVSVLLEMDGVPSGSHAVGGWTATSLRQDRPGSQSPVGTPVAGRIQNAQTIHSVVWLNGEGGFIGDYTAAYSAPFAGANTWYFPYVDQSTDFATYLAIQNSNPSSFDVTLTPHDATGALAPNTIGIAANSMLFLSGGSGLPLSFTGGVAIQADQPVTVIAVISGRQLLDRELYMPVLVRNN